MCTQLGNADCGACARHARSNAAMDLTSRAVSLARRAAQVIANVSQHERAWSSKSSI